MVKVLVIVRRQFSDIASLVCSPRSARSCSNLLCSIYPAYGSYKAVLSGDSDAQRHWLAFWVVNTLFTSFELLAERLVSWLPLYWEAKILFVCWLTLPAFQGASVLYHSVVHKYLEHYEPDIDRHLEAAGTRLGAIADNVRGTVAAHVRQKSGLIFSAASQLVADAAVAAAASASGTAAAQAPAVSTTNSSASSTSTSSAALPPAGESEPASMSSAQAQPAARRRPAAASPPGQLQGPGNAAAASAHAQTHAIPASSLHAAATSSSSFAGHAHVHGPGRGKHT